METDHQRCSLGKPAALLERRYRGGTGGRVTWSGDGTKWFGGDDGGWVSDDLFGNGADVNVVIFANGIFVVGGSQGGVKTSTDGKAWSEYIDGKFGSAGVWGIAYGNGVFFAVGDNGKMSESTNGSTWKAIQTGVGGSQFNDDERIADITTNGENFVIIGNKYDGNQSKVAYSF
ncbi:MAG: hypothetical protein LBK25_00615 [Treponema sp.]|jgi:hypothetical protein|nr:hypothetical protein [Treponema sp.]